MNKKIQKIIVIAIAIIMIVTSISPIFAADDIYNKQNSANKIEQKEDAKYNLHELIKKGKTLTDINTSEAYEWTKSVEHFTETYKTNYYWDIKDNVEKINTATGNKCTLIKLTAYLLNEYYNEEYDPNNSINQIRKNEKDENNSKLDELYIYLLTIKVKNFNKKYKTSVYDELKNLCTSILQEDELSISYVIQLNRDINILKAEYETAETITTENITTTPEVTTKETVTTEVPITTVEQTTEKETTKDVTTVTEPTTTVETTKSSQTTTENEVESTTSNIEQTTSNNETITTDNIDTTIETNTTGRVNVTTTNKPTTSKTKKVTKPSKVKKLKVYTKKRKAAKIKLTFKKVSGVKKYKVVVLYKKSAKKHKRTLLTKTIKANIYTIKSRKLKNKKYLYVRVRAYKKYKDKIVYGKWSKIRKVKIKK